MPATCEPVKLITSVELSHIQLKLELEVFFVQIVLILLHTKCVPHMLLIQAGKAVVLTVDT